MTGFSYHLVNVWTDPEPGPGGFNPMAASMLWLPEGRGIGDPVPVFIYLHRWGGYPYDLLPAALGPELADQGYGFLSLCLRRRGMEGQLAAQADNDLRDIKLAVDYLHTNGFGTLFLVGDEIGCISALSYVSKHRDGRVAGVALFNPTEAPSDWLRSCVGDDEYQSQMRLAAIAARQGAGMDVRIDLLMEQGPTITQNALSFLSWWSQGVFRLDRMLETISLPFLIATAPGKTVPAALAAKSEPHELDVSADTHLAVSALTDFARESGASLLDAPPLDMVRLDSGGQRLFALLWSPADGKDTRTAILLVHGLTSSPLSPLFGKMAPVLAQTGTAVLAVELRRSGWAGHESALLDDDIEDIDAWMSYLLERNYDNIVLAGASIGSISVGRYQSVRQHPNVAAIAHLMPTADCPTWFRLGAGEGPYAAAVEQAEKAIAEGRGASELIDIDIRQPPPNKYGGRFRWTQRAASWLSWWGPEADSINTRHIAKANVPLLLLSGTEDSYNDEARFGELKAAAVNAPGVAEIWYPDIDHGLAGVEEQVARDLLAWLRKTDVL